MTTRVTIAEQGNEQGLSDALAILLPRLEAAFGRGALQQQRQPGGWHAQVEGSEIELAIDAGGFPAVASWRAGEQREAFTLPGAAGAFEEWIGNVLMTNSTVDMEKVFRA